MPRHAFCTCVSPEPRVRGMEAQHGSSRDAIGHYDPISAGILREAALETIVMPYNDADAVESYIKRHRGKVAAVTHCLVATAREEYPPPTLETSQALYRAVGYARERSAPETAPCLILRAEQQPRRSVRSCMAMCRASGFATRP